MKWATIAIPKAPGPGREFDQLKILYDKHLFIGRSIKDEGLGGWQAPTTAALLAAWDFAATSVFFDVGANIGIYAAMHARLRPAATTIAFEPTPFVADSGESITSANGLAVRWHRVAVSDAKGEATLYLSTRTDASNSLVKDHRQAKDTVTVPTVTIDGYVRESGLVPQVIKIDVERHEPAVIRGATELLDEHRPIVVAELLPGRQESAEVQQLMAEHGYQARLIEPPASHTLAESEPSRDWLFWPGPIPVEFHEQFVDWYTAVVRCDSAPVHTS